MQTSSEWRVREEAEDRGYPTTHEQFQSYVDWGLLIPSPDGGWPVWTVDRLVEIRQAKVDAGPLPRRVVRLRSNYQKFPVPPALLKRAMIDMAGTRSISAPKRKLRRMNSAINRALAKVTVGADPIRRGGHSPVGPVPESWVNPHPLRWQTILRIPVDDNYFETKAAFQYHTDHSFGVMASDAWPSETEIPLEERILLLTVRDLSIDWMRAAVGRRNAVLNYRRPRDLVTRLVKEAAFTSDDPGADMYVVLTDGTRVAAADEEEALKDELRGTSNEYWAARAVHLVDRLPAGLPA
jgi:hypothetical protein